MTPESRARAGRPLPPGVSILRDALTPEFGLAALDLELAVVRQNTDALHAAAAMAAELAGAGVLDLRVADVRLRVAATEAGMGAREAISTIAGGFAVGGRTATGEEAP